MGSTPSEVSMGLPSSVLSVYSIATTLRHHAVAIFMRALGFLSSLRVPFGSSGAASGGTTVLHQTRADVTPRVAPQWRSRAMLR